MQNKVLFFNHFKSKGQEQYMSTNMCRQCGANNCDRSEEDHAFFSRNLNQVKRLRDEKHNLLLLPDSEEKKQKLLENERLQEQRRQEKFEWFLHEYKPSPWVTDLNKVPSD